jgi:hypothetical protein
VIEAHPARRQAVEVGRLDEFVTVAAKVVAQVVGDDEEDIEPLRPLRRGAWGKDTQTAE